ncbi:iron-sulfur cluster-binding domain-containing protein [Streptomyces sp. ISL-94]|uniref:iron-sulfur cluster-binding domain-containing protein n=1 Tax=Streptomyces sp. ISL-94 TaxID=2819190 RepID=UPI001BE68578|nr:iron-sulfur cluster-binding domain-containing protein [Streptomyces sp. ISL-94]MBT2479661.1 iron-sulfur cluster-binding domain-containing protein [Streptomyces sp. ISL-94]
MRTETVRAATVQAARALTPTVTQYWLTGAPGGAPLPAAVPGQHLTLRVGPRYKTYTVLASGEEGYELAVRNRDRGGRRDHLSPRLHVGAPVRVSAPGGHFTAEDATPFTHFAAGGVGINPVLAVLSGGRLRDWRLFYVDRGAEEFPFLERVQELAREQNGSVVTFDTAGQGRPDWDAVVAGIPVGSTVGVCGPAGMVAAVRDAVERAPGSRQLITDGSAAGTAGGMPPSVEVECVKTGITFEAAQHQPLLDALNRNGVGVPSSCRQGICGTCEVEVRTGRIDHRDEVLTDEEKAASSYMLPCVSKSIGTRLVLNV